jgi:hypothetical protein
MFPVIPFLVLAAVGAGGYYAYNKYGEKDTDGLIPVKAADGAAPLVEGVHVGYIDSLPPGAGFDVRNSPQQRRLEKKIAATGGKAALKGFRGRADNLPPGYGA